MEPLSVLRTLGALASVLGMLAGALWCVRRFDIRLPGAIASSPSVRRLELVERTALDTRRAVALVRRDGREHLLLLAPEGNLVIETAIVPDARDASEASRREEERLFAQELAAEERAAQVEALRSAFGAMVEAARENVAVSAGRVRSAGEGILQRAHPGSGS